MKTRTPLILTASVAEEDLAYFNELRRRHFPPDRNFLKAHLTMFHRLPGEYLDEINSILEVTAKDRTLIEAKVSKLRHLGGGVAYDIESAALIELYTSLTAKFAPWLGQQDRQKWKPHITVQNKVARGDADRLYTHLSDLFQPRTIEICGLDLWRYLDGPWQHEAYFPFQTGLL